jgi:hypothetical protein
LKSPGLSRNPVLSDFIYCAPPASVLSPQFPER